MGQLDLSTHQRKVSELEEKISSGNISRTLFKIPLLSKFSLDPTRFSCYFCLHPIEGVGVEIKEESMIAGFPSLETYYTHHRCYLIRASFKED